MSEVEAAITGIALTASLGCAPLALAYLLAGNRRRAWLCLGTHSLIYVFGLVTGQPIWTVKVLVVAAITTGIVLVLALAWKLF